MKKIALFISIILCVHLYGQAQDRWDGALPLSDEYLLQDVILTQPQGPQGKVDIWIKDGKIHKIDSALSVPVAVKRLNSDSLYAYPGFISALSHSGLKKEEDDDKPAKPDRPGTPTDQQAGILPGRLASEMIDPKAKSVDALRKQGFTLSHTVPEGKSFPGQGTVLLLKDGAPHELILDPQTAFFGQLEGSGRMYPATVIGVMAKWRDLYRSAERAAAHQEAYIADQGLKRPQNSEAIQALIPLTQGKSTVFFNTGSALSARRALELQKDLGFNMILSEVKESWFLEDALDSYTGELVISLDLPEAMDSDEEETADSVSQEQRSFQQKRKEAISRHVNQAKHLAEANRKICFSTLSVKEKDILDNIKRMVKAGLPEQEALRALTIRPAELLGVSTQTGSIEKGKLANLVLADKPIFSEKSKVRYVFVEGQKHEYNKPTAKKSTVKGDAEKVEGNWKWFAEVPGQSYQGTLELINNAGALEGTITTNTGTTDLQSVSLEDNQLSFSFTMSESGTVMDLSIDVEVVGDTFEGTVNAGEYGSFPFTGKRTSKPE